MRFCRQMRQLETDDLALFCGGVPHASHPNWDHAFFEQTASQGQVGDHSLIDAFDLSYDHKGIRPKSFARKWCSRLSLAFAAVFPIERFCENSMGLRKVIGTALTQLGQRISSPPVDAASVIKARVENLKKFWFLADAPQFIDRPLVDQLFDAIVQPAFELASRSKSSLDSNARALAAEVSVGGGIGVPTMLQLSATGKISETKADTHSVTDSDSWTAIHSSERRLEKLVNLYNYSYPDRCFSVSSGLSELVDQNGCKHTWQHIEALLKGEGGVRPLVVFDLGPGTKLLPVFAELNTADVVTLHEKYLDGVGTPEGFPEYPSYRDPDYANKSLDYWNAFEKIFDSTIAMKVVERAGKDSARLEWIDFRLVRAREEGIISRHLHISPRGQYPSGTFAYQFIRRAEHNGVRILGTLKTGTDVNVLAIYER